MTIDLNTLGCKRVVMGSRELLMPHTFDKHRVQRACEHCGFIMLLEGEAVA